MKKIIDEYLAELPSGITGGLDGIYNPNARCVIIPGTPIGKARPRMTRRGHVYTPAATSTAEALAKAVAISQCPQPVFEQPLKLELLAIMPVPKSWSKAKQAEALAGLIRPASTPDFDNIAKLYCDAMNNVLWIDDRQIVDGHCIKCYGLKPAAILWCWPASLSR